MFMTTVIKCHSLNYDIFNANMKLFEMSLLAGGDTTRIPSVVYLCILRASLSITHTIQRTVPQTDVQSQIIR